MGKNGNSAGYSDYGRTVVYTWKQAGTPPCYPECDKNGLDHGEKKISIVLERDQNQAVLRISNQVTHPEQINIDQVFERFYKADVARSKTSTGLGLSIAKELVSRMDGEIEAKIEKKEFIVEMNFPIVTDAK